MRDTRPEEVCLGCTGRYLCCSVGGAPLRVTVAEPDAELAVAEAVAVVEAAAAAAAAAAAICRLISLRPSLVSPRRSSSSF